MLIGSINTGPKIIQTMILLSSHDTTINHRLADSINITGGKYWEGEYGLRRGIWFGKRNMVWEE